MKFKPEDFKLTFGITRSRDEIKEELSILKKGDSIRYWITITGDDAPTIALREIERIAKDAQR